MAEFEEQRKGRNKETIVNHTYINSSKYKRKYDCISNNIELSRILYHEAKEMLFHRSGTKFEDMCWVDLDTLCVVAKETNASIEKRIIYSEATEKEIRKYNNLLTIHTHPDSFPPSIEDLNSNFDHEYALGVVACHNGTVYIYAAHERIDENYYKLIVERYLKDGYNENEAQIMALSKLQKNFDIDFKEVTDNDSI